MRGPWWLVLGGLCGLVGCDQPDEVTCEVEIDGVTVCVDLQSQSYCRDEWGGTSTNAEVEPGGPYAYCEDIGYPVYCPGSLVETGDNFTAEHQFYAATDADCTAADGKPVGE